MADLKESGCLTEEGIRRFRSAPIGKTPEALARHLADCPSCQRRVLAEDVPTREDRKTRQGPRWGRMAFLGAVLFVALFALYTILRFR
jgi:hypothetical protein